MRKIVISIILGLLISGCVSSNTVDYDSKPTENVFENADGFISLKDAAVTDDFYSISSALREEVYSEPITYMGVLYGDKVSEIKLQMVDVYNIRIEVDGDSIVSNLVEFVGAEIVDLDITDEYKELVVFADGSSADPTASFFRFNGVDIIPILDRNGGVTSDFESLEVYGFYEADEEDVLPTYGAIWTDQKGKVITSFDNIGFTDKRIALRYHEIEKIDFGYEWVTNEIDYKPTDREYIITQDFETDFTPEEIVPESYEQMEYFKSWGGEEKTKFIKGQKIKILDYGKFYNYYGLYAVVNGEKGVMTFWLGD